MPNTATPAPAAPMPPVPGFRLATAACGIKNTGLPDLLLVEMVPASVAGLFTRNQVVAAPVELSRQRLQQGRAQALVVNSGHANASPGARSMANAQAVSRTAAECLHLSENQVFMASTGVIGSELPVERIRAALPKLTAALQPGGWEEAAEAIRTTDTFPKSGFRRFDIDGAPMLLAGIAKGSGMIHPDMATMLGFLFTDASIAPAALQTLLARAVAESFNSITVDGDTSTNDTVLAFASGAAGGAAITDADDPRAAPLAEALNSLCRELAMAIVRDGEGAGKFVTITVSGARNAAEAKQVAMTVATSPLVKTALAGSDPNWGRILAAVGRAGVPLAPDRLQLELGRARVLTAGEEDPGYSEAQGQEAMAGREITIRIGLGLGEATHTVWTCDLTHDYISINADYRS